MDYPIWIWDFTFQIRLHEPGYTLLAMNSDLGCLIGQIEPQIFSVIHQNANQI